MEIVEIEKKRKILEIFFVSVLISCISIISIFHFRLFYFLSEILNIILSFILFLSVRDVRKDVSLRYLTIIGFSYFYISIISIISLASLEGLDLTAGLNNYHLMQLPLAGSFIQAGSFLAAAFFIDKKANSNFVFFTQTLCFFIILSLILSNIIFPVENINRSVPVLLCNIIEYFNCFLLIIALFIFFKKRQFIGQFIFIIISISIVISFFSDLFYVMDNNTESIICIAGQIFKILPAYLVYKIVSEQKIEKINKYEEITKILGEKEEMLRMILKNLPIGVWILNQKGEIVDSNPESKSIWKDCSYISYDLSNRRHNWMFDSGERIIPSGWDIMKVIIENEPIVNCNMEIFTKDGLLKIILNTAVPLKNSENQIIGAVVIIKNITSRFMREKRIETSNILFRLLEKCLTLREYLNEALNLINQLGRFKYSGIHLLNKENEISYESYTGFIEDQNNFIRKIKRHSDIEEIEYMTKGGSIYFNNLQNEKIVMDNSGKDIGFSSVAIIPILYGSRIIGVIHLGDDKGLRITSNFIEFLEDISPIIGEGINKYYMDEKIHRTQKELELAGRISDIGTLTATIAHEIRNPLATIKMAAYNIRKKSQSPNIEKHISNIEKKISESEQIINNLLFYSRINSVEYQEIRIYDILNESLDLIMERFKSQDVDLIRNYNLLSDKIVECDPVLIRELIDNILCNAYESVTDKKGIIEIGSKYINETIYQIYINDNGNGIDEEDLKRIYEPFFTNKKRGTGLGLCVCKQIVSLHKGEIQIENNKNEGITVNIFLPYKRIFE